VKDDRLGCITPTGTHSMLQCSQHITRQPYKANSETTANHVYNVAVRSLETIICRKVRWQSAVTPSDLQPKQGGS
ncbi:MAG: phage major capsid domain-containing protein, partial [Candidatus Fonsibacter sp.]